MSKHPVSKRRITLCMAYYLNPGMLAEQYERIKALPAHIRDQISVVVVDDGSPHSPAFAANIDCPLEIYRIEVDVRWNQDAARNIAVEHSATPWVLLTDIDHLVPRGTWNHLLERMKLNKSIVYRFGRQTLEDDRETVTPYKPHPNSWLMSRTLYSAIGGYDERFAGYYGTDAEFRDRVRKCANIQLLEGIPIIRVPRSTIPDASTTTYVRKAPEDGIEMRRIREERDLIPNWQPLRLTFPYHRVWPR